MKGTRIPSRPARIIPIRSPIGPVQRGKGAPPAAKVAGHPRLPTPSVGVVAITASTGQAFYAVLNGPAVPLSIDAGWEELERAKRKSALWHKGSPLDGWTLPLLFDRFRQRSSVENEITALRTIATRIGGQDPPAVRVQGIGPIAPTRDWVIAQIEPEEDLTQWSPARIRVRAAFTVTILERSLPDLVKVKPAKSTRDKYGSAKTRTYVVKKGDANLQRIALRELGDVSRWREIKNAKGKVIRDPKAIKVGMRLKLP